MYFPLKQSRLLRGVLAGILVGQCSPALAETAYIAQVSPKAADSAPMAAPQPIQLMTAAQSTSRQMSFAPTPETAVPGRKGNFAQTIQIGNANQVFQSQSGGNNVSNVGIWGGTDNDVGVWQGGRDRSNLNLINTQGLSIAVLRPPGSAPLNVLIARLPNGALLIKR